MRLLVFGDVHGNAPALDAVLADAGQRGYDAAVCLGDLVGYGPYPADVVDRVREFAPFVALRGNHDQLLLDLAAGASAAEAHEEEAVAAVVERHLLELDASQRTFLATLADGATHGDWSAAHGGFRRPFDYLATVNDAQQQLPFVSTAINLVGHTHVPRAHVSVEFDGERLWRVVDFAASGRAYRVPPLARAFLNPGSVGQPRDGNPAASYAMFDEDERTFAVRRVAYDVDAVARRARALGYPAGFAERLRSGR
mgnify:CR=1 FL=1